MNAALAPGVVTVTLQMIIQLAFQHALDDHFRQLAEQAAAHRQPTAPPRPGPVRRHVSRLVSLPSLELHRWDYSPTSEALFTDFVRVAWRVAVTAGGHRDTVGSYPREIGGGAVAVAFRTAWPGDLVQDGSGEVQARGMLARFRGRRGFRNIRQTLPCPADAPKPGKPGPGRPPGSKNRRPATRHDVGKTVKRAEPKKKSRR